MRYSFFTMLCDFQPYSKMNQPCIHISPSFCIFYPLRSPQHIMYSMFSLVICLYIVLIEYMCQSKIFNLLSLSFPIFTTREMLPSSRATVFGESPVAPVLWFSVFPLQVQTPGRKGLTGDCEGRGRSPWSVAFLESHSWKEGHLSEKKEAWQTKT